MNVPKLLPALALPLHCLLVTQISAVHEPSEYCIKLGRGPGAGTPRILLPSHGFVPFGFPCITTLVSPPFGSRLRIQPGHTASSTVYQGFMATFPSPLCSSRGHNQAVVENKATFAPCLSGGGTRAVSFPHSRQDFPSTALEQWHGMEGTSPGRGKWQELLSLFAQQYQTDSER